MTYSRTTRRLALLLVAASVWLGDPTGGYPQQNVASTAQLIDALQSLRDAGVISEGLYRHKVAALRALPGRDKDAADGVDVADASGTALSPAQTHKIGMLGHLKDTGELSEEEYKERVAEVSTSAAWSTPTLMRRSVSHALPDLGPLVPSTPDPGTPAVEHALLDPAWGLPWGTIELPYGWGFNGGVVHAGSTGCAASGDSPMWAAESPDKLYGIAILPLLKTNWTTDPALMQVFQRNHCPIIASDKAVDYLVNFVLPQLHKDFHVVSIGPEPQFAHDAQQMRQQVAQWGRIGDSGFSIETQRSVDTARVFVQYPENGRTVDEIASTMISCTDTRLKLTTPKPGQLAQTRTVECTNAVTVILHQPSEETPQTGMTGDAANPQPVRSYATFFKVTPSPAWSERLAHPSQQVSRPLLAEAKLPNRQRELQRRQFLQSVNQRGLPVSPPTNGIYAPRINDYSVYTAPDGKQLLVNQYRNSSLGAEGTVVLPAGSTSSPGIDWQLMTPRFERIPAN